MKPKVLVTLRVFPEVLDKLRQHFEVEANSEPIDWPREEIIRRAQGKQGLFVTTVEPIDAVLVAACPELKAVCSMAVGYNNIDVAACAARGIVVTNAPDVLTETTADFGFALMMAAARRVAESEHFLRAGQWERWSYDAFQGVDVHGATLGILGMGRIGQAVARRGALGFGMPVIYHNRSRLAPELEAPLGARWVEKDELFAQADHVVIVLPYSKASHHTVGAAELARMKPTATLTNIARGGVVDDAALAQALAERRLFSAALDVFDGEPHPNPALLAVPNIVLTPHIASATRATRMKMAMLAADNLIALLGGKAPLTAVTPPAPAGPASAGKR
jgi:glyoxylate/hydroxypyruvate/2-ketogluconate reductase